MDSTEIRQRFLKFFEKRGHAILPSAPLVPENDPSVLFNTAGMQPLVPYLMGEPHPQGKRLANSQKCVRTQDIDEVGDNTHDTFFEMLGNWSLGDYFKEEAIKWSFELLTSDEGFKLDPRRLYVTVFAGNDDAPKDTESFEIWKKYIPENRIYFLGWNGKKEPNWWEAGANGPCGPDTEMFYDVTPEGLGDMTKEEYLKADDEQKVVEIWNNVFMEYVKKDGKVVGKLPNKNVDTGAGLERLVMVLQKKNNIFDTDLFKDVVDELERVSQNKILRSKRIVADHIRTSVMLIADGVTPTEKDQGYILRKLIRRSVVHADKLGLSKYPNSSGPYSMFSLAEIFIKKYESIYSNIKENRKKILEIIGNEEIKFRETLKSALKILENYVTVSVGGMVTKNLSASKVFELITSYGMPREIIEEEVKERGFEVFWDQVELMLKKHQELSRAGAEKKFKGGMGDTSEKSLQYHTATHLLHQALRMVLGNHVSQKGSNITPERLRFDFTHGVKMTDEEKKKVEDIVNEQIQKKLPVEVVSLPKTDAEKTGALHFFGDKYGDTVTVYYIGENIEHAFSKEFCGGPHVKNTSELKGIFKIQKEEAVSAGVRRIKATIE